MEKIIWIDTRQKPKQWDWLKEEFKSLGFKIKDDKPMTYGDYCMPPNLSLLVDTKYDILEIVGNVIQQHERFVRELEGATTLYTQPKWRSSGRTLCVMATSTTYNTALRVMSVCVRLTSPSMA